MTLSMSLSASDLERAVKDFDPKQGYTILMTWWDRATKYAKGELRARTPATIRRKVYVKFDAVRPPRWARVGVRSPLTWLIEGGTGQLGDPTFNHNPRFFPNVDGRFGIMEQTGLPRSRAFLVARQIFLQGGTRPRPFVRPTYDAVRSRVVQMGDEIVREVTGATP